VTALAEKKRSALPAALALGTLFIAATLPTPLYPLYKTAFGFSGVTLTLVYAVYVLGNLSSLLFFGGIADRIGRRRTVMPSLVIAIASTLAFMFAASTSWLFLARLLSGLATGLGSAATTAWLADLQQEKSGSAARNATLANFIGLTVGPIISGAIAQFGPYPLTTTFVVYVAILAVALIVVWRAHDATQQAMRWDLLSKPRIGVPREIIRAFFSYATTGFVTFALIGFYAALVPNLLSDHLGISAPIVAGAVVCLLFAVAVITIVLTTQLSGAAATRLALILLIPSLALLIAAELARSMPILMAAAALGGVASALGYRGSLAGVNAIAPSEKRSEILSGYLISCFCGNSLPVVGIGLISARVGATAAHEIFAVVIGALAAAALFTAR
jgi:MFS family permease